MRQILWYFDFVSPYSYLQFNQLETLPAASDIRYRPVVFAGLLRHWGHLGPAEIPSKRRFVYQALLWQARRDGILLRFPPVHPFNPLPALRLAVALRSTRDVVDQIFRFIWQEGRDVSNAAEWTQLCARLGVSEADQLVNDPAVKAGLRSNTDEAIAAGVFGVPTVVVDGRLFWGNDSTEMLREFLSNPAAFNDAEYRRVAELPYGVSRR